jgi:hypothetical protein
MGQQRPAKERMVRNRATMIGLSLALSMGGTGPAFGQPGPCQEFEELDMTLEQNATDGDTEVVFFAKTETDGLHKLRILSPAGRRVASFDGDKRGIGIREFLLESAEPPELDLVLGSFPEGTYTFLGRTVGGDCVTGEADLSHGLAPATTLLTPAEDDVVEVDDLLLSWAAVPGAERYVVELNNEDTGSEFTLEVFPPATSLVIPAELLAEDSEYQFAVGVKMPDGNVTFVELAFFTAAP